MPSIVLSMFIVVAILFGYAAPGHAAYFNQELVTIYCSGYDDSGAPILRTICRSGDIIRGYVTVTGEEEREVVLYGRIDDTRSFGYPLGYLRRGRHFPLSGPDSYSRRSVNFGRVYLAPPPFGSGHYAYVNVSLVLFNPTVLDIDDTFDVVLPFEFPDEVTVTSNWYTPGITAKPGTTDVIIGDWILSASETADVDVSGISIQQAPSVLRDANDHCVFTNVRLLVDGRLLGPSSQPATTPDCATALSQTLQLAHGQRSRVQLMADLVEKIVGYDNYGCQLGLLTELTDVWATSKVKGLPSASNKVTVIMDGDNCGSW